MSIIKCKMCGGDLEIIEGSSVCECTYCGTKQTVPSADNEKKLTLFARAGRLLRACEFDKASGVFESIVADYPEEAEAYWGLVLCKYGIEYVDDPATGKKIPTCHRSSFESALDDANFEQACENTDAVARRVYRDEARAIEELRQAILQVSGKEEPYDVFISYKETDGNGERTLDSVIAQDIYKELTREGYRVFFSRISLEDKLGTEYEPYIFAALNSAKVMLVVGTDYENFDAVWVKNEWSRFLKLIAKGERKTLIPIFKNMDAYDMPKEFAKLSAQDMGKVGAMQDLLRGIEKIIGRRNNTANSSSSSNGDEIISILLNRGSMALEDGEWDEAKKLFDQVLNLSYQNAQAYLGLALSDSMAKNRSEYEKKYVSPFSEIRSSRNAMRARQFDKSIDMWFADLDKKAAHADILACETAKKQAQERFQKTQDAQKYISAAGVQVLGVKTDGTVYSAMLPILAHKTGQDEVSNWTDIVAVSAGSFHSVGLRADHTVVSTTINGRKFDVGQANVSNWTDIVAVAAGGVHTVGLKSDGTVVATQATNQKYECGASGVSRWNDIVSIAAGNGHTVGLKADGTVVAVGRNETGQCEVTGWSEIVAISAGDHHTVGLKKDGTVIATKHIQKMWKDCGQCEVSSWNDIIAVAAGSFHTLGLKKNGTVVATTYVGDQDSGQCNVSSWTDIVAVAAGEQCSIGLRSDGTVLCVGHGCSGNAVTSKWKLFNSFDTIEAEQKLATERELDKFKADAELAKAKQIADAELEKTKKTEKIARLSDEKKQLVSELPNLKGLFAGSKKAKIEARIAEIEVELRNLE